MKTVHKFSFSFNQKKLEEELQQTQQQWTRHFNTDYYNGEWSGIALRSPVIKNHPLSAGHLENNMFKDERLLGTMPYTQSVINHFQTEKLSIRYLRLTPGSEIKAHRDYDMVFWDGFVRLHIPIVTNNQVQFNIAGESIPMPPGSCWFADFSKEHSVQNNGTTDRVHLVIDCNVTPWLNELFVHEGIITKDEQKPNPLDQYTDESRKQLINELLAMNTETSLNIAGQIAEKYGY